MSDPKTPLSAGVTFEKLNPQQQQLMQMALRGPLPRFYANALGVAQTPTDLSVVFLLNGNPTTVVSLTYPSAKTLIAELTEAIERFESTTGEKVKSLIELAELMGTKLGQSHV